MILAVAAYLGAVLVVMTLAAAREGRFSLRKGLLEFAIAVLLPGLGLLLVILQLVMEALLRRRTRGSLAALDQTAETEVEGFLSLSPPDVLEELKAGLSAESFGDLLRTGNAALMEPVMRRLARAETPAALQRLKESLQSPEREVRLRARALLVRVEDRLVHLIRTTPDPAERARAYAKLGLLSMDPATARRHLERAADSFREAVRRQPFGTAALEWGRVLMLQGDLAGAREAFHHHIRRFPSHPEGYLARAEVHFRSGDVAALRADCAILARFEGKYGEVGRRWCG